MATPALTAAITLGATTAKTLVLQQLMVNNSSQNWFNPFLVQKDTSQLEVHSVYNAHLEKCAREVSSLLLVIELNCVLRGRQVPQVVLTTWTVPVPHQSMINALTAST